MGFNFLALTLATFSFASLSSFENALEREIFDLNESEISVVVSLVDSSTVSKIVQKYYDIDGPVTARLLSVGINDIYLVVTDNKKYVLRLSRADKYLTMTPSEFQFELEWLEFLNLNDIPVSYPIRRMDNQLYGLIEAPEGPRFFTLFSYAEGSTDMNVEQAYLLGNVLARLHLVSNKFNTSLNRSHLDVEDLITISKQRVKEFFAGKNETLCVYLDKFAAHLKAEISEIDIDILDYGIIGGDIHGYNQHMTKDNQITLFDFEFCAYGYRVYDIATFLWSRGSSDIQLWNSFLDGYQSIRTLSDTEMKAIEIFVKIRHLWWMGMRVSLPESKHTLDAKFWDRAFSRFK